MLGGSLFREFENDPFFTAHNRQFQSMQEMFPAYPNNMLSIQGGNAGRPDHRGGPQDMQPRQNAMAPFGMFDMGFQSMFSNMRTMMGDMQRSFETIQSNPAGHCFTQTSFSSYTNTGEGPPQVYQASSSTRSAPGGVQETRKSIRDSESGLEKMSVGRHIHDRGHVIERSRNRRLNENNENQDYINLDENDIEHFNREWSEKTSPYSRGIEQGRRRERNRNAYPAIEERRERRRSHRDRE